MNQADYPPDWQRGQLLNLRRYGNGTFVATLIGEEPNEERSNVVDLASADDAQQFVSWWYAQEHGR